MAAAEALLLGSTNVSSKHRSILDPQQHQSKAMRKFREEDLSGVRQQFFNGELPNSLQQMPLPVKHASKDQSLLTPEERLYRIESRLRRVVVKACENSYAASQVVNILEEYLIRVHQGKEDTRTRKEWLELLLEPPTLSSRRLTRKNENGNDEGHELITRFLFDADSSTGGFHRLLLHGVCQFHGLTAISSTMRASLDDNNKAEGTKKARVLTASGVLSGANVGLVDLITKRQSDEKSSSIATGNLLEKETRKLAELHV